MPQSGSPPVSPIKMAEQEGATEPQLVKPSGSVEVERETMKAYWTEHSAACSVQEMMLDDGAEQIERADREEILGLLPAQLEGKRVLELAAGACTPLVNPRWLQSRFLPRRQTRRQLGRLHRGNRTQRGGGHGQCRGRGGGVGKMFLFEQP